MATLGSLLPADQADLLPSACKALTQSQLEAALENMSSTDLTVKELAALRKVSMMRINGGESAYTWSSHNFSTDDLNDQDPNTCSCI